MFTLSPLEEDSISEEEIISTKKVNSFRIWLKNLQIFQRKSNLKVILSVMACPLSPFSILPKKPSGIGSSAEYIVQQFRATSGCGNMERNSSRSMYVAGRVALAGKHRRSYSAAASDQEGSFVMWQKSPDMWLINFKVAGLHVSAGSDGHVAWRRTPWLAAHASKGCVRPLRRALQGLDPMTIAATFSPAHQISDKKIDEENCYVLRLKLDASQLSHQSDNTIEVIQHTMLGCFSERSGLLVHIEDSQLMRIEGTSTQAIFLKTIIQSWMTNYEASNGVMVARSGRSVARLEQFGTTGGKMIMMMEENWVIDDVDFNVAGLSADFFIPPQGMKEL